MQLEPMSDNGDVTQALLVAGLRISSLLKNRPGSRNLRMEETRNEPGRLHFSVLLASCFDRFIFTFTAGRVFNRLLFPHPFAQRSVGKISLEAIRLGNSPPQWLTQESRELFCAPFFKRNSDLCQNGLINLQSAPASASSGSAPV